VLLLGTLLVTACHQEITPLCTVYDIGAVEGYVYSVGQGIATRVEARAVENGRLANMVRRTMSDSTGWYRLELPTGLYLLEPGPQFGSFFFDLGDTVRIVPSVRRFDLNRCRVEIQIDVPSEFEGQEFHLNLKGSGIGQAHSRTTALDGTVHFIFPVLSPATYVMELECPGTSGDFFLPGFEDSSQADSLTVVPDSITTYAIDFATSYATISGHITGSWQEALVYGPSVQVMLEDFRSISWVQCQADGSFTCDIFVPQPVRLQVRSTGGSQWIGGDSFETAQLFDLQPGDRICGVELVESGLGIWLDGPGDLTAHEATASLFDEDGSECWTGNIYNNPAHLCNLRPGRYFLQLDGNCYEQIWVQQWFDGVDSLADATPIELGEGELRRLTMSLVEGGRIEGRVTTAGGPLPWSLDCGLFTDGGEPVCGDWRQWRSCPDGIFVFAGLSDGEYYLAAEKSSSAPWWYPGTYDFEEACAITIADHGISWDVPSNWQGGQP